jgi:hypothetical protein
MTNSRYKNIRIDYFEDRELYALSFSEKKMTDTKWLNRDEVIKLAGDINNVLQTTGKK